MLKKYNTVENILLFSLKLVFALQIVESNKNRRKQTLVSDILNLKSKTRHACHEKRSGKTDAKALMRGRRCEGADARALVQGR